MDKDISKYKYAIKGNEVCFIGILSQELTFSGTEASPKERIQEAHKDSEGDFQNDCQWKPQEEESNRHPE